MWEYSRRLFVKLIASELLFELVIETKLEEYKSQVSDEVSYT